MKTSTVKREVASLKNKNYRVGDTVVLLCGIEMVAEKRDIATNGIVFMPKDKALRYAYLYMDTI